MTKTLTPIEDNAILLMAVIENAVDGILIAEEDGGIQLVNQSFCHLFGYNRYELVGLKMDNLLFDSAFDTETIAKRRDGSEFPCRLAVSHIKGDERNLMAAIVQDITREKQTEAQLKQDAEQLEKTIAERTEKLTQTIKQLKQAQEETGVLLKREQEISRMKSRFVSMASHEFRSPLSSIQLSASLIERYYDRLDHAKVMSHLHKIKASVSDLTNTLDDFLSVERIESGNVKPVNTTVDLTVFCADICEEMTLMKKAGQQITYTHCGDSVICRLDKNLLKHCLVNLISNAIKYSPDGGMIRLETTIDHRLISITVSDTGIGVPPEQREQLFAPFFRADNAKEVPGTGLGLNIVKRYAELMNGTVSYQPAATIGSSFILCLPVYTENLC